VAFRHEKDQQSHRSLLPTSVLLLLYPYRTLTKTLAHHRERYCSLAFQSIGWSRTYWPGLIHLQLVRVITLARESDLHRFRALMFCFGFSYRCMLCLQPFTVTVPVLGHFWLQIFPWHACHGDPHVTVDSGAAGLSGHAWIQPARQRKLVSSQLYKWKEPGNPWCITYQAVCQTTQTRIGLGIQKGIVTSPLWGKSRVMPLFNTDVDSVGWQCLYMWCS
jgi:hypothetical protein